MQAHVAHILRRGGPPRTPNGGLRRTPHEPAALGSARPPEAPRTNIREEAWEQATKDAATVTDTSRRHRAMR
eukprot:7070899-Pyramimonas_sp.AAC.1